MKFNAAIVALAVGLASAAPSTDLAKRATKGNVLMCSGSGWKNCGVGPTTVTLDGKCAKLPKAFYTQLGSFGPDPDMSCIVFQDDACSVIGFSADHPGIDNLYSKVHGTPAPGRDPTGKNQIGHALRAYRCFPCSSCK